MTTAADDAAVEQAFEAFLAGRPVPSEAADLAAFAGAVRSSATEPGRPNAALAELLVTGLLVDQPPLSARTAKRRRRPMWFFTALVAKIASASAVAQAATGAGLVLVGFTTVGAAGALPAPAQHTFATVVAAITPLTPYDGSSTSGSTSTDAPATTSDSAAPTTAAADPTGVAPTSTVTVTTAPKNFGESVSQMAKNGGVDGQEISKLAHERNAARKGDGTQASDTQASDTQAPETEAPETEAPQTDGGSSHDGSSHGGHGDH